MMRKNWIAIVILVGLVAWGIFDYLNKQATDQTQGSGNTVETDETIPIGIKVGNRAPNFALQTEDGETINLSDYRGKTVLLNFWASWCPPCKVEMPYMQDFYEEYKDKDVVVLAVNMTHLENNSDDVKSFLDEVGVTFPTMYDQKGQVTEQYQIVAYPTTYILNTQGVISDRYQGAIDHNLMVKAYEKSR
ncbi:TlpA family protein disulfide reductase [Paenibacillus sp. N3/727]|uniref:peroxiredoxin family protein n=1 Tax=Paenibacillus sp. N3/727 TaxID=2925845 RepID=UPI001F537DEB|nr:TlpA disulfide reductase family protein [Paenibacillus sp. N3/727]UNK16508.1 TlpA family protein disulfide reductase [Paenibacillus sp. N3/727]